MPIFESTTRFQDKFTEFRLPRLRRAPLQELQINLGRLCNQACHHCHVDAGPKRKEVMAWSTMERIIRWARGNHITKVDITGGTPEMNPHFLDFVDALLDASIKVTSRCNLSIIVEPGYEYLADWYADRNIRLVCSLPCYTETNVDSQRGRGVFTKSIAALKILNYKGYGLQNNKIMDLVYNPGGPFLPPDQNKLEHDYKTRLKNDHDITFSSLLALTNLPINRFLHSLERENKDQQYMALLSDNFNPNTVEGLMCRHLISVDWLGQVYDCDFNQMLDLPLEGRDQRYLWDINTDQLDNMPIAVDDHCLGCTAGTGSSCGGALA